MKKILQNKYVKMFLIALVLLMLLYILVPSKREEVNQIQTPPIKSEKKQIHKATLPKPEKEAIKTPEAVDLEKTKIEDLNVSKQDQTVLTDEKPIKEILDYPAGETVEEAWKTLVKVWNDQPDSLELDIFTETGKIILKDPKYVKQYFWPENPEIYLEDSYKIMKREGYAVVDFEKQENVTYRPFLFFKTKDGWKFDLVHQKKLIKINDDEFAVEKFISPYVHILRKFPTYSGIDVPLEEKDYYKPSNDAELAKEIKKAQEIHKKGEMTFQQALNLGRIYSLTAMSGRALPLLKAVKRKFPETPDVYKYLAIAQVYYNYEYDKAIKNLQKYMEFKPKDPLGHNFLGYLYSQIEQYDKAEQEYQKALELDPESCYAVSKLGHIYGMASRDVLEKDEDPDGYKKKYKELFNKASNLCKGDEYERFIWMVQWRHSQK